MRTEKIKVYKFNELNERAKEKAIEDHRSHDGYLDYEWFRYLHKDFIRELNTIGVDCEGFEWDLYGSKKIKADRNGIKVTNKQKLLKSAGLTKWLIINELREEPIEIYSIGLSEKGEAEIELEEYFEDGEDPDREKEIKEIEEKITEFMKEKFEKFWGILEKEYSWLMSDEAISEHLEMNDYEFTESGEKW